MRYDSRNLESLFLSDPFSCWYILYHLTDFSFLSLLKDIADIPITAQVISVCRLFWNWILNVFVFQCGFFFFVGCIRINWLLSRDSCSSCRKVGIWFNPSFLNIPLNITNLWNVCILFLFGSDLKFGGADISCPGIYFATSASKVMIFKLFCNFT